MGSEHLFLLFQDITDLFLEVKELLVLLVPHGPFHGIKIIFDLFLIFHFGLVLNLDLLINNILIIWVVFFIMIADLLLFVQCRVAVVGYIFGVVSGDNWFFVWIWTILFLLPTILFDRRFEFLSTRLRRIQYRRLIGVLGVTSLLWNVIVDAVVRLGGVLGDILWLILRLIGVSIDVWVIRLLLRLLLLNHLGRVNLLDVLLRHLLLSLEAFVLLHDLVAFLA